MRLKIQITCRFFRDTCKDWTRYQATIVQFRLARLRVVQHDQTDKFGVIRRQITAERNDVLSPLVTASRVNLLGRPGLACDGETCNGRRSRGAAIAHYPAQRIADLSGCLRRNDLA